MRNNFVDVENANFQFCSTPDSIFLEFLNENNDAFMDIEYDENNKIRLNFYNSNNNISIPIEIIEKGIEIIKKRIKEIS